MFGGKTKIVNELVIVKARIKILKDASKENTYSLGRYGSCGC